MDTIKGRCYTGQSCIQRFYHPNTHLSDRLITRGTLNSGYRCCKYRLFRLFIACVNQKHATIQFTLGAFTNKYTCLSTHVHAHIHTNTCLNTHVHLLVHTGALACIHGCTCLCTHKHVLQDPPFIIHEESCGEGVECYSGYCIDLVRDLAKTLGFSYQFRKVRQQELKFSKIPTCHRIKKV